MMVPNLTSYLRIIMVCTLLMGFTACKSTKITADGTANEKLSTRAIIKNHYKNQPEFRTLSARMKIDYSDGGSSKSVGVSLRIERDKTIWLSAPLGVIKAYITPERVSFYNKLQNEYFDGDFGYLSQLLGVELDYDKVQNLLLGQALFDLRKEKYDSRINDGNYQLQPEESLALYKALFQIEPANFRMAVQQLSQPLKKRLLEINYRNYQEKEAHIVPNEVGIVAIDDEERTTIGITYKNIEFNRDLNFPYKIPKGFDEIELSK